MMSDKLYEDALSSMEEVEREIQEKNKMRERLDQAISDKIESLINQEDKKLFIQAVQKIVEDLMGEGFEKEDVLEYISKEMEGADKPYMESVLREWEGAEREDTYEIMFEELTEEAQRNLLHFVGKEDYTEMNWDNIPIAVVPRPENDVEAAAQEEEYEEPPVESKTDEGKVCSDKDSEDTKIKKLTEEEDKEEAPTKSDVSRDVKDLIKQAKDALNDGDYIKAADCVSKLAQVQNIVPPGEVDIPVEEELEVEAEHEMETGGVVLPDEVDEVSTGKSRTSKVHKAMRKFEPKVSTGKSRTSKVHKAMRKFEEGTIKEVKALKDISDTELESLMNRLSEFNKSIPNDVDMSNTMGKVQAEIERRKASEKE